MIAKIIILGSSPISLINFRLPLIKALLSSGYDVIAIAPFDQKIADALQAINVKFVPIKLSRNGINPFNDIILINELYSVFRKEKADFILSYTMKPVIYGSLAAKLAGIPNIYAMITGTGYLFHHRNLKNKIIGSLGKKMLTFSLKFTKKIFFQNKDNLNDFIADKLITANHSTAIINGSGVDIMHFNERPLPANLSFLMIARLLHDKGIREYVEAAQLIKQIDHSIKFYLVGSVDSNPNSISKKQLDEWIASGVVDYLGQLSDVRPAIANASVYVLPSYSEGTPRSVLEAMAMGRPIITTDAPGCRETVVHGKNGFLVPVQDAISIANAMRYFIEKPNEIVNMGKVSRQIAVEKYDVDKVNDCILKEMAIH